MVSFLDDICKELDGASLLSTESQVFGYVDSGSKVLNKIISGDFDGGYPIGSITEIYGESSTAKTVFLTHAFIGAQKQGYYTVMVDNEHAYSPSFAEKLGIDSDKLIYTEPETLEDCFETIEKAILAIRKKDKETPIIIGYDSIGSSPSRKEMDDTFGKNSEMGGALRAKVAGQCLRRINPLLRKYKAGLIIVNQVRSKVGVMFGDPRTRAGGGKALLYYCGTSLEAASGKSDALYDDRKNPLGITGTIKAVKNKITKPFQSCEFKLLYDQGLMPEYGLTIEYYKQGLATVPAKGWYSIDGGKTKSRSADLDRKIMEQLNGTNS
jgi:recombination protein RecA|tara:strand:+ start:909 stop:1880 length:972 start_codon:yes stop_codon:yes gene_type:complete